MTPSQMVAQFHAAFGLPHRLRPALPDPLERTMRLAIMREEMDELSQSEFFDDIVGIADALGDIVYVAYGTALTYGIDLDAVIEEIHRSNMTKLGADGKPVTRADGKVLKGPDYQPPDLRRVLEVVA